jgi:hypothetical protein
MTQYVEQCDFLQEVSTMSEESASAGGQGQSQDSGRSLSPGDLLEMAKEVVAEVKDIIEGPEIEADPDQVGLVGPAKREREKPRFKF